jgi:hypothetical protein
MSDGNADQDRPTGTSAESLEVGDYDDEEGKSVTASQLSYGERGEAYDVGQAALAEMVGKEKPAG